MTLDRVGKILYIKNKSPNLPVENMKFILRMIPSEHITSGNGRSRIALSMLSDDTINQIYVYIEETIRWLKESVKNNTSESVDKLSLRYDDV